MRKKGSRFLVIFALLLVALSQIMCKMPTKEEAIKPLDADVNWDKLSEEVFDITVTDVKNNCPDHIQVPELGPVESFEIAPEGLNVTNPDGTYYFGKVGERRYCQLDVGNQMVCISNLSETGYILTVYDEVTDESGIDVSEECYSATHILTSTIDELLAEEIINEVPEEEGETAPPISNDPQPQPENPPQPELQPDPVAEDSETEACNASSHISISGSRQDNSGACTCAYRLTFENNHTSDGISILLKKTVDLGDGPVTRWEVQTIASGATYTWRSDLDDNCAIHQVDSYSAIFDTSACIALRSSNPDEVNAMAVPVETMCTEWSKNGE